MEGESLRWNKALADGALHSVGYAGSVAETSAEEDRAFAPGGARPGRKEDKDGGGAAGTVEVRVRGDFRDTAVWRPDVVTDEEGRATVELTFPDQTTRWKAVVRAHGADARFGFGEETTRTRQPLIARLQAPRFFQVGDECLVTANLNNRTEEPMPVHVVLEATGLELLGCPVDGELLPADAPPVQVVEPGGSARVDWLVRVTAPGAASVRLTATGPAHGDAIERTYPVVPHGVEALVARAGKMVGTEVSFALDLPARAEGSTELRVQVAPSLAVTMLDALPYLVDYPYGCTEQTLSRFLPAVVVAKTLNDFGLSAEDALGRVFGGIESDLVDATQPGGAKRRKNLERLDEIVAQGLRRLYDLQHADGGWGWWSHGESDHWMSAYVVWGLTLAEEAGVEVRPGVLERGRRFLQLEIVEREEDPDMQAWMLHALAARLAADDDRGDEHGARAFDNLWEKRRHLNAYSRALLTLAAVDLGRTEEARILRDNLANGVIRDDSPDTSVVQVGPQTARDDALRTAHWGEDGIWSRWSEGGVEATAFVLRALLAVEPGHELVAPTTNWLVQNRRGAQWSNTRDTAICVLALNDFLRDSGELSSEVAYEVLVNDASIATVRLGLDELLAAPSVFAVPEDLLVDGPNRVRIVRSAGDGPLYFGAQATFFSEEEPIPARGSQVFVRREYYKLVPVPTLLQGVVYEKRELGDGDVVQSGERVEVVLTVEAKNHLEYLVFEDLKPAGLEAVQVRSGEWMVARELKGNEVERRFVDGGPRETLRVPGRGPRSFPADFGYTGRTRHVHQELRDRKVGLFLDKLPQGVWEMRYELRAEVPGRFHALPVLGHAMYVPEIRCNSNEVRIEVLDPGGNAG